MDPEDIFKQFFVASFPELSHRGFGFVLRFFTVGAVLLSVIVKSKRTLYITIDLDL